MSPGKYDQHKIKESSFVKLNRRRLADKGLGHSATNANDFDRRDSITTNSSTGKTYSYISGKRSMTLANNYSSNECNRFKNNSEFTERRSNYERMTQKQYAQPCERQSLLSVSLPKCYTLNLRTQSSTNNQDQVDRDLTMLLQGDSEYGKFLSLRKFRLQNSHECFADGRYHNLQLQSSNKLIKHCDNFRSRELVNANPTSMPYALRQNLLRRQLINEMTTRMSQSDFINNGLNKHSTEVSTNVLNN